jgi:hypothetical protein
VLQGRALNCFGCDGLKVSVENARVRVLQRESTKRAPEAQQKLPQGCSSELNRIAQRKILKVAAGPPQQDFELFPRNRARPDADHPPQALVCREKPAPTARDRRANHQVLKGQQEQDSTAELWG